MGGQISWLELQASFFSHSHVDPRWVAHFQDLIARVFVGNALLPDQEEYREAGADFVLTKPVREESVRNMLEIADKRQKARLPRDSISSLPKTPPPDQI